MHELVEKMAEESVSEASVYYNANNDVMVILITLQHESGSMSYVKWDDGETEWSEQYIDGLLDLSNEPGYEYLGEL